MTKDIMTSGIEMSDVIKATGFPVPSDLEGKTFAECVSGGGGDITVEALSATENKVYTAPEGKAYSPVTVNVPTSKTVYAWRTEELATLDYKEVAIAPNDLAEFKSSKVLDIDSLKSISVKTEGTATFRTNVTSYERISDTSFKIIDDGDEYVYTRDSTEDITLW